MEVILDRDTGRVYVKRERTPEGVTPKHTHQYAKFGVTLVWDGRGELLGIEFDSDSHELATIRTLSSEELRERERGPEMPSGMLLQDAQKGQQSGGN
jgi:hypothetical protein